MFALKNVWHENVKLDFLNRFKIEPNYFVGVPHE